MFHQILLGPADQLEFRIRWGTNPEDLLRQYFLKMITYGLDFRVADDNSHHTDINWIRKNAFYMSDLLYAASSLEEAQKLNPNNF